MEVQFACKFYWQGANICARVDGCQRNASQNIRQSSPQAVNFCLAWLFTEKFCALGSHSVVNVSIACTLQCNTLTGFLKTTGWIGRVYWEEQDFIRPLWTITVSHLIISLKQSKIGAWMHLWYVYACVFECVYKYTYKLNVITLWHITKFWGRAKRLGCPCSTVRKSRHRVPMVRTSLESAWPCFRVLCFGKTRLYKPPNDCWVCRRCWTSCAAMHLSFDTELISGFHPTGSPSERSA